MNVSSRKYTPNVGGVLRQLFASASALKLKIFGTLLPIRSYRSLRTMVSTTPAGPRFFCAPAYTTAVRAIGCGRDIISELASTTRFGCSGHSTSR